MPIVLRLLLALMLILPGFVQAKETLLMFSGDLRGEIEPCGCSEEGDMGGLPRKLTLLKQLRSSHSSLLYFELGNNFPEPTEQGKLKNKLIQNSLKLMNPAAILIGPNEWANGLHSLDVQLPYLLSNHDGSLPFAQSKSILLSSSSSRKVRKIELFGFLSPKLIYQNSNETPAVLSINNDLLNKWQKSLYQNQDHFKILMFRGDSDELELIQKAELFDLIVVGSNNNNELKQVMQFKTPTHNFPMIPTKGQGVLLTQLTNDFKLKPVKAERAASGLSIQWLHQNVEDAPELDKEFKQYNDAVKDLFFSNLDRMDQQRKESPFIGDETCLECHEDSVQKWKKSRHADAFETLVKVGKQFDPECLECHVVGLKPWKAGDNIDEISKQLEGRTGYLSPQITPHLSNVQCENCHGPSRLHIENEERLPPVSEPKSVCKSCHMGSHSPKFDLDKYWPKIEH